MDENMLDQSLKLLEILKKGYRQDKNGRWVHKGKYGLPKELVQLEMYLAGQSSN